MLYQSIAQQLHGLIDQGYYSPGERLPGVRKLAEQLEVSVSTIVKALQLLESNGVLMARPRSGYYVSPKQRTKAQMIGMSRPQSTPTPVTGQQVTMHMARVTEQGDYVSFGAALPHDDFFPMRAFQRSLQAATRTYVRDGAGSHFSPGLSALRVAIAQRMLRTGSDVSPDQIILTSGCHEALRLALGCVAERGDIVAIESPTFYGLLQVVTAHGIQVVEIPTDPQTGMSLSALELALEKWPIKAIMTVANVHNPLGTVTSDAHKQALVALARRYGTTIIEDDVYGDLVYTHERPRSIQSFDDPDQPVVVYCSSFSKTISQGARLGWIVAPETLVEPIGFSKYVTNHSVASLSERAVLHYLSQAKHDRYLRHIRYDYAQQVDRFQQAITTYFPDSVRLNQPQGGFLLWVELPESVDAFALSQTLLEHHISIAPGCLFSTEDKYNHCIRINCAQPWGERVEQALQQIGQLAKSWR